MNPRIVTLLSVVMFACTEEASVMVQKPFTQTTLQFHGSSMTIVEGQKAGLYGDLAEVRVLSSEVPSSPIFYFVIMKYKATDLGGGMIDSRFYFDGRHTKFDGTPSTPAIVASSFDASGMLTTVIQMEFEKGKTTSNFIIGALNNSKSETDEIATLEVTTKNPVSGDCPGHLTIGTQNSLSVTIMDFN